MQKLLSVAGVAALAAFATAQTVVIPQGMDTTYTGNTSLTWRNSLFHFQMIYDPSHFLNQGIDYPITITRMRYRAINGATSAGGETYTGVTAIMCSSPSSYASPSTTFAANLGANATTVFQGNVVCTPATGGTPNDYVIDVVLQTPFVYDPTAGLDFLIDVNAPSAPLPTGVPNMAASSLNTRDLARRVSTATAGAATGSLSDFASVVMLDYTAPPNLAAATPYGSGCMNNSVSFYENMGVGTFDLQNSSVLMTPLGTGYAVAPGSNSWFTPTSPDLALGDDALSPSQALGFTFPFPGGSTTDILVCSNGFIWLDNTQTAATYSGNPALLLGQAPRLAPFWNDMNPSVSGTVHFDVDPAGGAAYVTWDQVPLFNFSTTLNTLQVALYSDGRVEYRYQSCTSDPGIMGWSHGGGANDPGSIDVSASMPFLTTADTFPLSLRTTNRPKLNTLLNFEIGNVPATATVLGVNWGFFSLTPPVDLTPIGMPTCYQLNTADVPQLATLASPTATYSIQIPNDPNLVGLHMYVQALCDAMTYNALGIITSNGVDLEFGSN